MKFKKVKLIALAGVFLVGLLYFPNIFAQATIGVNVNIKPVLMLEVLTPSHIYRSAGAAGALLNTKFSIEENPIYIRVRLSIPKGQVVQLHVQANGDLISSDGKTFPISNIAWHAKGEGFVDGILSNNSSQVMATWNKSGYYEGVINYYWVKSPSFSQDFTQIITYTLIVL
ncbi:hypothetical protein NLD30_11680 [SCandidatus Aminicenantes bacterium Aminicenantia_JdfR_composite]|jgi:hypothetical protein|nr:hypothetical protein [SCandidatus Aminicenantes bacterium Aminicenantia_JdfR_composite]